jgi:hypothetical protein
MSFSDYLENKLMDHVFGGSAYTAPGTIYLALFTANPGDDDSGTELSGNNYSRKAVSFTVTDNAATNSAAVEFDAASGSWGTIIAHAALTASKTIAASDVFRVPAGDLDITLD